jgi:hypothetical protein
MEYIYYLANASLTQYIAEYLKRTADLPVAYLTVIHQIDGWVIRIKMSSGLSEVQDGNLRAVLNEAGIPYHPPLRVCYAFRSLESGQTPVSVMHQYRIAIVAHGQPDQEEIATFRQEFVRGLGYCPQSLV